MSIDKAEQRHWLNPSWKGEAEGHKCILMTSRWTWQIFVMSHKHETLFSLLDSQEDLLSPLSTTGATDSQNTNICLSTYTPLWYQGKEAAQKIFIPLYCSTPLWGWQPAAHGYQSISNFKHSGLKTNIAKSKWILWTLRFDCLKVKGLMLSYFRPAQHEHVPHPPSPTSSSRPPELWQSLGCSSEDSTAPACTHSTGTQHGQVGLFIPPRSWFVVS